MNIFFTILSAALDAIMLDLIRSPRSYRDWEKYFPKGTNFPESQNRNLYLQDFAWKRTGYSRVYITISPSTQNAPTRYPLKSYFSGFFAKKNILEYVQKRILDSIYATTRTLHFRVISVA